METRNVWIAVIIVVILVALGGWYILAHENITSALPSDDSTTTIAGETLPASEAASSTDVALEPATVATNVVGSWQSTDDPNYTVKITAGGKWTDAYGADASASQTGTYTIFTSQNPDKDFTGVLQPGIVYIKLVEGSSTYYYSVLDASGNTLQISYLDRGNTLSFTRVQ